MMNAGDPTSQTEICTGCGWPLPARQFQVLARVGLTADGGSLPMLRVVRVRGQHSQSTGGRMDGKHKKPNDGWGPGGTR